MSDSVRTRATLLTAVASGAEMGTAIRVASVVLLAALTAAAAQVSVPLPFTPVPFTLQPMVVLLGGAALGSRLGMSAQVVYLLAGIAGLPVFAASPVPPARRSTPARADGRIPLELSDCRVCSRRTRRTRLRSALHHLRRRHGLRPRRDFCVWRHLASAFRETGWRRVRGRAADRFLSVHPRRHRQDTHGRCDHAGTLEADRTLRRCRRSRDKINAETRRHGVLGARNQHPDPAPPDPGSRIPVILRTQGSGAGRSFPDRAVFRCD